MLSTWLTYPQASRRTGRSLRTLRGWRAEGMRTKEHGGQVWIHAESLHEWERRKRFLNPKRPRRAA